jgi:HlyD family secretion protein
MLLLALAACGRETKSGALAEATSDAPQLVAGPGRVESASEEIKIGAELSGKIRNVLVEEGDKVSRGQLLASLENDDYLALVDAAEAAVRVKQAALRKIVNGARVQERSQALSVVRAAEAVLGDAQAELQRRQKLFETNAIAREELDRALREYDVAKAQYEEAQERHSLVDAKSREEDRALGAAELDLAQANLKEARARYEKTLIRSPIDGTVLRKHHRTGENVSNSATVPDPIFTVGDKSVLHVRVEVDETDVSRVRLGQRAYVTADAFGARKFWGRLIRVGQQLGRKNIRTDEPTEHVDAKILETLLELEPAPELPVGLRVDAFILADEAASTKDAGR